MKDRVLKWIENGKDYNDGVQLLPKFGIYENLARIATLQGYTKKNAEMVEFYLRKLSGLDKKIIKSKKIVVPIKHTIENSSENLLPCANITSTDVINAGNKIRSEFPFLNDKNCPNELKILVSDRITAYHDYISAHKKLFDCPEEQRFEIAKTVVESYMENKLIWEELNYFRKYKKLLKKHPLFKKLIRYESLKKMNAAELAKEHRKAKDRIWRNNDLLKKEPDSELTGERMKRKKDYQDELTQIEKLMESR